MPYGNYSFVVDSTFRPYSFREMLEPLSIYAEAYKEAENKVDELVGKADTFKYLASVTDNDDPAKKIYEGYVNDLMTQAQDLSRNGLTMNNRRALTNLKRRYTGEIGMLERADEQLRELQKNRNALAAAGKTILYGNDNPRLSDFLGDGNSFNRYAIDAADLRTRGNALGKAMSSREYSNDEAGNLLQDQYRIWRQTHGIRDIDTFMQSDAVRQVVDNELIASGAADNLKGRNLKLARQNLLNGIYESVVYEEAYKPLENGEYMSAKDRISQAQAEKSLELQANLYGKTWDKSKGRFVDDPDLLNVKGKNGSSSSSGSSGRRSSAGSNKLTQSTDRLKISWKGNNPNNTNEDADTDYEITTVAKDEEAHPGRITNYENLPQYAKDIADELIGDGTADLYDFYFQPYESGLFGDTEAELEVVPREIKEFKPAESLDSSIFGSY